MHGNKGGSMKKHIAQKMFETDLTAALQDFYDDRRGRRSSEEAEVWMKTYTAAKLCGYSVTSHFELDKSPVALVTAQEPIDKDMERKWNYNREVYSRQRAIVHNDADPENIDIWEPNSRDLEVLDELGVVWSMPQQQEKTVESDQEDGTLLRQPRSRRQAKPLPLEARLRAGAEKHLDPDR
jgi:hypothetical protein